ncbi:MAG: sigma-70 family RNA polymerase sigma factor [Chitinophagales bacterium]|nr:sigma-70 family RNA polymerase sigma factor [Chitinophagales bacterium]
MYKVALTDSELIDRFIVGDERAIATLLSKYQKKVYNFILSRVKDNELANDLFQDTFIKAIDGLKKGNYSEEGKFLQWIMMIANNLCMDYFRKQKRSPNFAQNTEEFNAYDILVVEETSYEDILFEQQQSDAVRSYIELLPNEQKQVLLLRHYADLSFKEIAEITNTNINTALGRMRYAIINLKRLMEEKNFKY